METWRAFTLGMMIAGGISVFLLMPVLLATRDESWQKKIVGHGVAHYTTTGAFEWNNEK